ncbi:MAG: uracil phosphoribosyltransferase [Clostridia bacterium]|nr:uracil phosphoribosyltransferase [Clostridia bacterium]
MSQTTILNHNLLTHKLTLLRDKNTDVKDFRNLLYEIATLIAYEVTKTLPVKDAEVETPLCKMTGAVLENQPVLVPILRAGLGMVEPFLNIIPAAKVGHIGLARNHDTHLPEEYYCKLPDDISQREVIVLDPMLATGGSGSAAIDFIKKRGAKNIRFACIIAAPEGVEVIKKDHPDVDIFVGVLDECLNENAYIVPGLGDAGDRLFGTL